MMLVSALALVATVLCMTNYGVNDVLIHPIEAAQTSQKLKDGYYGGTAVPEQAGLYEGPGICDLPEQQWAGLLGAAEYVYPCADAMPIIHGASASNMETGMCSPLIKNIYSWSDDLQQFDYVYLFRVDEAFAEQFGVLFDNPADIGNDRMYRVRHEGGELVQLSFDADMSSY